MDKARQVAAFDPVFNHSFLPSRLAFIFGPSLYEFFYIKWANEHITVPREMGNAGQLTSGEQEFGAVGIGWRTHPADSVKRGRSDELVSKKPLGFQEGGVTPGHGAEFAGPVAFSSKENQWTASYRLREDESLNQNQTGAHRQVSCNA